MIGPRQPLGAGLIAEMRRQINRIPKAQRATMLELLREAELSDERDRMQVLQVAYREFGYLARPEWARHIVVALVKTAALVGLVMAIAWVLK